MIDLLLSFSAWFLAAGILLPAANFVIGQTFAARQESDAGELVYNRLVAKKLAPDVKLPSSVTRDGTVYTFINSQLEEICVEYQNISRETKRECAPSE